MQEVQERRGMIDNLLCAYTRNMEEGESEYH
jgi:hypothetical protein